MSTFDRNNKGYSLTGNMVLLIAMAVLYTAISFYTEHQLNITEISAVKYSDLAVKAKTSCSGNVYLKEVVSRGPILGKDFNGITSELND